MQVECKQCGHTLDPNTAENEHLWGPPKDVSKSIGALTCPECTHIADFVEWKSLTTTKVGTDTDEKA